MCHAYVIIVFLRVHGICTETRLRHATELVEDSLVLPDLDLR